MILLRPILAALAFLAVCTVSSTLAEAYTPDVVRDSAALSSTYGIGADSSDIDSLDLERAERSRPEFTRRTKVGLSGGFDYLTDSMEAWNSVTANFSTRMRPGRTLYGYLRQQERFGDKDLEGLLGMYYKLSPRWMLVGEVKASPTHKIVPIWMGFLQAEYGFGNGWRAGLGGRYSMYDADPGIKPVAVGTLMIEKYFSDFRAAYNIFTSNLRDTVGLRLSHLAQVGYYYGGYAEEVSSINVGMSFGVESAEFVDPNMFGLDLKTIFIRGDHWFLPRWAVTYDLHTNSQKHYSRYGIDLGLDYRLGTDN
jgi:YaiO family outer membrane protein